MVVFSLSSGHVMYASEQAPSILCCKRKFLESAKFVELLFHQDVNVFYSHTAQLHLPPWSNSHTGVLEPYLFIMGFISEIFFSRLTVAFIYSKLVGTCISCFTISAEISNKHRKMQLVLN